MVYSGVEDPCFRKEEKSTQEKNAAMMKVPMLERLKKSIRVPARMEES